MKIWELERMYLIRRRRNQSNWKLGRGKSGKMRIRTREKGKLETLTRENGKL